MVSSICRKEEKVSAEGLKLLIVSGEKALVTEIDRITKSSINQGYFFVFDNQNDKLYMIFANRNDYFYFKKINSIHEVLNLINRIDFARSDKERCSILIEAEISIHQGVFSVN